MLAQTVAFQVKAYEYRALMASIVKAPPLPKGQPGPDLMITWVVNHSKKPVAPPKRDRQEVRRSRTAAQGGHRAPSQDPLGGPGAGRPRPRLLRPVRRVAPQPEILRTLPVRAQVLIAFVRVFQGRRPRPRITFPASARGRPGGRRRSRSPAAARFVPRRGARSGLSSRRR